MNLKPIAVLTRGEGSRGFAHKERHREVWGIETEDTMIGMMTMGTTKPAIVVRGKI